MRRAPTSMGRRTPAHHLEGLVRTPMGNLRGAHQRRAMVRTLRTIDRRKSRFDMFRASRRIVRNYEMCVGDQANFLAGSAAKSCFVEKAARAVSCCREIDVPFPLSITHGEFTLARRPG